MRFLAAVAALVMVALSSLSDVKAAAAPQATGQERQARAHPALSALPANTAHDLGPYQCTAVEGENPEQCRLVTDYSGMVYDPKRHRMVVFGGGHASTNYDGLNTLDLNTLRWVEEYPPTPCSAIVRTNFDYATGAWRSGPAKGPYPRPAARHTTDQLIIVGDELIMLAGVEGNGRCSSLPQYTSYDFTAPPRATHYDFRTKTWTFHQVGGGVDWPGAAYDPPSNKIILLNQVGLEIYDPVAKTKVRAIDLAGTRVIKDEQGNLLQNLLRYNNNLVYYPPNQRHYYFEFVTQRVYELNLNRSDFTKSTITRVDTTGAAPPALPIGYAYDPVNKLIGGGPIQNVFYAFDPASKSWASRPVKGGTPGSIAFHAIDYDPVNNVFIFITDHASGKRTWAYRYGR
jgi:hypothetical protein